MLIKKCQARRLEVSLWSNRDFGEVTLDSPMHCLSTSLNHTEHNQEP